VVPGTVARGGAFLPELAAAGHSAWEFGALAKGCLPAGWVVWVCPGGFYSPQISHTVLSASIRQNAGGTRYRCEGGAFPPELAQNTLSTVLTPFESLYILGKQRAI
jgi:hypothetical protein